MCRLSGESIVTQKFATGIKTTQIWLLADTQTNYSGNMKYYVGWMAILKYIIPVKSLI